MKTEPCKVEVFDRKGLQKAKSQNLGMRCKIRNVENELNLLNCHKILANKDVQKIKL